MDSNAAMLSARDGDFPFSDPMVRQSGNCLHCIHAQFACRMVTIPSR